MTQGFRTGGIWGFEEAMPKRNVGQPRWTENSLFNSGLEVLIFTANAAKELKGIDLWCVVEVGRGK